MKKKILTFGILSFVLIGGSSIIQQKEYIQQCETSSVFRELGINDNFYERDDVSKATTDAFSGQNQYSTSAGKFGVIASNGFGDDPYNLDEALAGTWTYEGDNYIKDVNLIIDWDNLEIVGLGFDLASEDPLKFVIDQYGSDEAIVFGEGERLIPHALAFKIKIKGTNETFWIGTPTKDHEEYFHYEQGQWLFPSGGISIANIPLGTKFGIEDIAFGNWYMDGKPLQTSDNHTIWSMRNPLSKETMNNLFPILDQTRNFTLGGIEYINSSTISQDISTKDILVMGDLSLDGELLYDYDFDAEGYENIEILRDNISLNKDSYPLGLSSKNEYENIRLFQDLSVEYLFEFDSEELFFDSYGNDIYLNIYPNDELGLTGSWKIPLIDEEGSISDIEIITGSSTKDSFKIRVNNTNLPSDYTLGESDSVNLKTYNEIDGVYIEGKGEELGGFDFDDDGVIDREIISTGDKFYLDGDGYRDEVELVDGVYKYKINLVLGAKDGLELTKVEDNFAELQVTGLESGTTYYLDSISLNGIFYGVGDEGNRLSETTLPHYQLAKNLFIVLSIFIVLFVIIPLLILFIWRIWRSKWNINFHADVHGYKTDFIELVVFNIHKHKRTKRVMTEDLEMWFLDKKLDVNFLVDSNNEKVVKARIYLDQFEDHEVTSKLIAGLLHDHISIRKNGKILDKIHYIQGKKLKKALKKAMAENKPITLEEVEDFKEKMVITEDETITKEVEVSFTNLTSGELDKVKRLPLLKAAFELGIETILVNKKEVPVKDAPTNLLEKEIYIEKQVKARLEIKHKDDDEFLFDVNDQEAKEMTKTIKKEIAKDDYVEIEVLEENKTKEERVASLKKMKLTELKVLAESIFDADSLSHYKTKADFITLLEDEEI